MSVTINNIVAYGCLNMPESDGPAIGGVVDFTKRVSFYDISPNGTVDFVSSSGSDTATKAQIQGRDVTGIIQTPAAVTLTGTVPVVGVQIFERLECAILSGGNTASGSTFPLANPGGTAAVGDVAVYAHTPVISAHTMQAGSANTSGTTPPTAKLQSGDGAGIANGQIIRITSGTGANQLREIVQATGLGTDIVGVNRDWGTVPDATSVYSVLEGMLFEIAPNPVTSIVRCFMTSAADVSGGLSRYFFEKVFAVNNNTATSLTAAQITITSVAPLLPSGALLDMALCTALNDANSCTPRQQISSFVPTGSGGFVTQPALVSVPGAGNLPSGAAPNGTGAQGIWLRLTLPAGTAAYKGSADLRAQGNTV